MKRNCIFAIALAIMISVVLISLRIETARSDGPIYIRSDGLIEGTDKIVTSDSVTYTFIDDIFNSSIVIQRNNIVLDGVGFRLDGTSKAYSKGVELDGRSNVTVRNMTIAAFDWGIHLYQSSNCKIRENKIAASMSTGIYVEQYSSNNIVSDNTVTSTQTWYGICVAWYSEYNSISGNNVSANNNIGIHLLECSNNNVSQNEVMGNGNRGIYIQSSSNTNVFENNVSQNVYVGIELASVSNCKIWHNRFVNNTDQVAVSLSAGVVWDNGYPLPEGGGNYWSDYADVDVKSGPYQNETGSDGIWDDPYVIDGSNKDNYPIVPEFSSTIIVPVFLAATLSAAIVFRRKRPAHQRKT